MLDYATCLALKEAGFPQDGADWYYGKGPGHNPELLAYGERGDWHEDHTCAKPNSDELIAAIQQRWQGDEFAGGTDLVLRQYSRNGDFSCTAHGDHATDAQWHYGPTPVAALAALYLALAKEQE